MLSFTSHWNAPSVVSGAPNWMLIPPLALSQYEYGTGIWLIIIRPYPLLSHTNASCFQISRSCLPKNLCKINLYSSVHGSLVSFWVLPLGFLSNRFQISCRVMFLVSGRYSTVRIRDRMQHTAKKKKGTDVFRTVVTSLKNLVKRKDTNQPNPAVIADPRPFTLVGKTSAMTAHGSGPNPAKLWTFKI